MELAEEALHLLQVRLAAAVEAHVPLAAVEQGYLEMLLQPAYAVGGGGLEELQAFAWGQEQHGSETSGRLGQIAAVRMANIALAASPSLGKNRGRTHALPRAGALKLSEGRNRCV